MQPSAHAPTTHLITTTTLIAGTIVGATTQHFASADVTSGDRPVLVPIETCRIADTRPAPDNVGPKSSPLGPAETVAIDAQQAGTDCTGKIPATAAALSLNVTALNATSNSFITVWPDGPQPTASALNPAPGQRVFNAVTTELAADQTFRIFNNRGNVDVFVDINGYYENHIHDDRYYTKTEVDTALGEKADLPNVTVIQFSGTRTEPSPTGSFELLVAAGTFTKQSADTLVRMDFSGHGTTNGSFCHFQLRIDGRSNDGSDSLSPTFAQDGNAISYAADAPLATFAVFPDLAAGEHTAQIYVRGSATSCQLNRGNFSQQMLVEEFSASPSSPSSSVTADVPGTVSHGEG